MTCVGFLIFGGLLPFVCCLPVGEGQVFPPSNQSMIVVLPDSTARLKWTFKGDPSIASLAWYFARRGGSTEEEIAVKFRTRDATIPASSLPGVAIENTSTLVLKNVDERYNGKYQFSVQVTGGGGDAEVELFVAEMPTVTLNCSSSITQNEGDNVTCVCRGEGGNPPANVTWYKDGVQIGGTKQEINTLTLKNVNETDGEIYTCLARSYPDPKYEDNETIVLSKPENTSIKFSQNPAKLGNSVIVTCESRGFPKPSYIITLNGTIASGGKIYTIDQVKWNDTGIYNCTATNSLGSDLGSGFLNVTAATVPGEPKNGGINWFIVIMSLLGVVIIGILLSYIVWRSRRKFKSSKHQSNPEPQTTEVDPTYQGLDLNKMNKEDNYQSLTGNYAASNDVGTEDESAYTELKKIRDVEDQYQSLQ